MYITGRTNPIDFGKYRMNIFLQDSKKNSYKLRPTESNSLKCSSIQIVHSIELKSGIHITGLRRTNSIDFGECRMHRFLIELQLRIHFCFPLKKFIHSIFTKINRIRPTVSCNIHTKFGLNRMHRLEAIVFTHIHTCIHTSP